MADTEKEDQLTDIKTILNSLVITNPKGYTLRNLCRDYNEIEGGDIPYKELGYNSLSAFLRSMPDTVRMELSPEDNSPILFPTCNADNEHIIDLVNGQSKRKQNRSRSRGAKRSSTPMDPRLSKKQRPSGGSDDTNGWADDAPPQPVSNGNTPNGTPQKPFHMMTDEEAVSIVSVVRQEMPITTIVAAKNGIDSKLWEEIFEVKKETDVKSMSSDTTGMMAPKASLREPLKIGEYSLKIGSRTSIRQFINDASELKYLHLPPAIADVTLDLTHGYDMVSDIHWGKPSETKLEELLKWISCNRKKFMLAGELAPQSLHTDFICYRGTLSKIMATPYESKDRWVIGATKFKGTIYLCQFHEEFPPPDDFFNKMSFGGFRFEQYLTSYEPTIPPDPNDFDPDHHEYCTVMRTRLISDQTGGHSLVFGAELDAVMPGVMEQPGKLKNFVELKTTRTITNEGQYRSFCKFKLLKWWIQSYLVGVPQILCGYKDNKHIVKKLEQMAIDQFPVLAQEFWSANVCLNFLNKTLDHMKQVMTIDDPNVVYVFSFAPDSDIRCTRLIEPGEFQILPEWFIKEFSL